MEQTDLALAAQRTGAEAEARTLFRSAFEFERQAAALLAGTLDAEPTRSILHRSAASLALDCDEHREAEILIREALRGNPPEEIAEELRDLLEQVYSRGHRTVRTMSLADTETQQSIAGPSIGVGIAPVANMRGIFEIKKAKDGQFYFRLKASNGQVILASEMYQTKSSAINGIESVKKNAPTAERYDKLISKTGKFYFTLKAANNQVIGNSEMYESETARDNGIASLMKNPPSAVVADLAWHLREGRA